MRFLGIGHLCRDIISDKSDEMSDISDEAADPYRLGGSAAYAGIAAHRLGADAALVTSHSESFDPDLPPEIDVRCVPAEETTTFENRYGRDGARTQRLHSRAADLVGSAVPPDLAESGADALYFCPLADEVKPCALDAVQGGFAGASIQGWLREWDERGNVRPKRMTDAETILPRLDALILSEEDIAPFPGELERLRRLTRMVVLTRGRNGAVLYEGGRTEPFPAYRAQERDPTGAGDVFAAAFLIRYAQTGQAGDAVDFANCAGSFAVESVGTEGAPTEEQIRKRRQGQ